MSRPFSGGWPTSVLCADLSVECVIWFGGGFGVPVALELLRRRAIHAGGGVFFRCCSGCHLGHTRWCSRAGAHYRHVSPFFSLVSTWMSGRCGSGHLRGGTQVPTSFGWPVEHSSRRHCHCRPGWFLWGVFCGRRWTYKRHPDGLTGLSGRRRLWYWSLLTALPLNRSIPCVPVNDLLYGK